MGVTGIVLHVAGEGVGVGRECVQLGGLVGWGLQVQSVASTLSGRSCRGSLDWDGLRCVLLGGRPQAAASRRSGAARGHGRHGWSGETCSPACLGPEKKGWEDERTR